MPSASPRARILVGAALALLLHASLAFALLPETARAGDASSADARRSRAALRAERSRILASADDDIASGRATLGETLIRLGAVDAEEERSPAPAPDIAVRLRDRDAALATYRALTTEVRTAVAAGLPVSRAIVEALARDGRAARYKRMYPRLVDALAHGGGNCVALSTLAVALAHDAGHGEGASMRVYANHVAPDVDGFRFGMAKRCHGPGEPLAAGRLLDAYARARATGDGEPFAFPRAEEPCDDPGDVFGDLQLVALDPPPLPALPHRDDARAGSAPESPRRPEPECRRRTVLEEYEDDVEVLGADGRSLGGVGLTRSAGALDLAGHAASSACLERRLEGLGEGADATAIVLALGDAAMAAEEAARVFAAAGEVDVSREYERRLGGFRARAAAPLEQLITRLGDPAADVDAVLAGAGRLVALGEGGRTAMLLASERHRGFWELANLMTRPSSQLGAIARFRDKPVDVKLDVIDALPCASETFQAQLHSVTLPSARTLEAACTARAHVDREPCALDEALAHTRERLRSTDGESRDLAEAVLVRNLSARCREPAFAESARRWAEAEPPPIARALASRIGSPPVGP